MIMRPENLQVYRVVEKRVRQEGDQLQDIRGREIRQQHVILPVHLETLRYETAVSTEHFLQFVDAENHLLGFLRLSLPHEKS
jgi:elongator complex protein 3